MGAAVGSHQPADLRAAARRRRSARRASTKRCGHVELLDRASEIAGKLSKGLKQRVAIARALHSQAAGAAARRADLRASIPASARHIRDLILGLRSEGRADAGLHAQPWRSRGALGSHRGAEDGPARLRHAGDASQGAGAAAASSIELEGGGAPRTSRSTDVVRDSRPSSRSWSAEGARIVRVTPDQRSLEDVYLDLVGAER